MSKKALIVIDMQYDFLPGGALAVENGDEIIPVINRIQEDFDVVVATQDWHPEGHHSFASSHPGKNEFEVITMNGQEQVLWPDHCVQGSRGAELSDAVDWRKVSAVFRKGMDPRVDSYSGFFDNNRKNSTGLSGYLQELDVSSIYVAGLAADYCVYYTAKDGKELGFDTYYILNATREISKDTYQAGLKDLENKEVHLIEL